MHVLEVDLAIFERLVGAPLDNEGNPKLDANKVPLNRSVFGPPFQNRYNSTPPGRWPSWGIQIPMEKQGYQMRGGLTRKDPQAVRMFEAGFQPNNFRRVPVFDENMEGRDYNNIWPCVTFRFMREAPQRSTFVYSDDFAENVGAVVDIENKYGEVIQSNGGRWQRRKHPESFDLFYLIRVSSKSPIEMRWICERVQDLFPMNGGIEVTLANESKLTYDMLLEDIVTLDKGGNDVAMNFEGTEQREFVRGFMYRVEAYLDNTVNKFGFNDIYDEAVVTQRLFELATMQDKVIFQTDHNKDELFPIE